MMHMLGGGVVTAAETQRLIGSGELDLKGYLLCVLVVIVVACLCMITSQARRDPRAQDLRLRPMVSGRSTAVKPVSCARDLCLFLRRLAGAGVSGEGGTGRTDQAGSAASWAA